MPLYSPPCDFAIRTQHKHPWKRRQRCVMTPNTFALSSAVDKPFSRFHFCFIPTYTLRPALAYLSMGRFRTPVDTRGQAENWNQSQGFGLQTQGTFHLNMTLPLKSSLHLSPFKSSWVVPLSAGPGAGRCMGGRS